MMIDADALRRAACGPGRRWGPLTVVAATGSTNADLAAAAREGAPDGTVLVAERQTAGRGRFVRSWVDAPAASVALSVLLRPGPVTARWGWLPLVAGLAVHEALGGLGAEVALKWPNDVLATAGGKLCGILAEHVATPGGAAVVVGVGINVGQTRAQLPVPTATSLALLGLAADRTAVVAGVLSAWQVWQARWDAGVDLRGAYRQRCATIGRRVAAQLDAEAGRGDRLEGVAVDVDAEGSLLIETQAGRSAVAAGDVVHLR